MMEPLFREPCPRGECSNDDGFWTTSDLGVDDRECLACGHSWVVEGGDDARR